MTDERTAGDPTVERFDPQAQPDTMMAAEHLARYHWAQRFVGGRRVLDAGSGTGFGTLMLAEAGAEHVVGIDNDASAIEQASADRPDNVEFAVCDVTEIPFDDASFDIVTCMEVIEHVESPERVLDELHRVLKPDGLLLLSTPNKEVVVPGNPFHLHEFTPDELIETISRRFRNVAVRRQHTWVATGVMDDATLGGGSSSIEGVELHGSPGALGGEEPTTLAIASDGEIPADRAVIEICEPVELRAIDRTFHDQRNVIDEQQRVLDEQQRVLDERQRVLDEQQRVIDEQTRHGSDLRTELAKLRSALVDAETQLARMAELEGELQETTALADELRDVEHQHEQLKGYHDDLWVQYEELKVLMDSLLNSTSWKVTSPMRKVMASCRSKIAAR